MPIISAVKPKTYKSGGDAISVIIKIGEKIFKNNDNDNITITKVRTEITVGPEAGICEIELSAPHSESNAQLNADCKKCLEQIQIGKKLEVSIKISEKSTVVFTGFVERFDIDIPSDSKPDTIKYVIHGMDAKMWMMTNMQLISRGKKTKSNYKAVVKDVFTEYATNVSAVKVSPGQDVTLNGPVYQVHESDFEFLKRIANKTDSLFFINSDGTVNFCGPSTLCNKSTMELDCSDQEYTGEALSLSFSASLWGMPKSVKVVSLDNLNPQKKISASSSSSSSIGSGKSLKQILPRNYSSTVTIVDNSVESQKEAQALAEAIYSQRILGLTAVKIVAKGDPAIKLGSGFKLQSFGKPIDNTYIVNGIVHEYDAESNANKYTTTLSLTSNKLNS